MGFYGDLRGPVGVGGTDLWGDMWFLWGFMGSYRFLKGEDGLWGPMGGMRFVWGSMGSYGVL